MSNLVDIATVPPIDVWGDAVRARRIEGEQITLAIVELKPNSVVPEHTHPNEQIGFVIQGSLTFTIDGETRELGPGGTWKILSMRPHQVTVGPEGAIVVDVFSPTRSDWDRFPLLSRIKPVWPGGSFDERE
jgi:quercetin dioxygenase-like cupin family protein